MRELIEDVQYGFRRLRRSPGFTVTALATLALGIGATTAIFTLAYQVILKSMPVDHPEQLYKVGKSIDCCATSGLQNDWSLFSVELYQTLRDHTPGIDGMAATQAGGIRTSARRSRDSASQPLNVRLVSGNYFEVLGVRPFAGRLLRPEDDREGAPAVAVLSHAIWLAKFHGDPSIVGETITMTGHPVIVVGIAAENFLGDRNTEDPASVWLALAQEPLLEPERNLLKLPYVHWLDLLLRIPDPKAVPVAESAIKVELLRWIRANPGGPGYRTETDVVKQTTELGQARDGINELRDQYEKSLLLLQMIAGFVLLIACANLANLMLVRGIARRQELSVRSALGASRARLIREMLTEALLVSLLGGGLALAVAQMGVKGMLALAMKGVEISPLSASPSLPVLGFALAVSAITGVLFGIAPAWIASNTNPVDALRGANRATGHTSKMQRTLVVLQAALSVALLSVAGLLILSLNRLETQDLHFQTNGRLIAFIDLAAAGYRYEQLDGVYRQIDQRFAAIPALHDVAYATYGPMAYNYWKTGVVIDGGDPNLRRQAGYSMVSPSFFTAVGTRLLAGRAFTDSDTATSRHVAVVNQTFVNEYLQSRTPIGMHFGPDRSLPTEYEIVGVVDDSKYGNPADASKPMFFTPIVQITSYDSLNAPPLLKEQSKKNEQFGHFASNLIVRYEGDSVSAAAAVRKALNQINPDIVITRLTTYDDQVSNYFTQQRLVVRLTSIFGLVALILASIGLYGVTAYGVARRIPEIGVRMALGADRSSVVRLVLRESALQVGLGILVGIPLALLGERLLQSQLYEVKGTNVATLIGACFILVVSASLASALPARSAASVEPMQALRAD